MKLNEECMITGQYGLAKKFKKYQKQVKKDQYHEKHERMLHNHNTMQEMDSTDSKGEEKSAHFDDGEAGLHTSHAGISDFVRGSNYALNDFLNMSNSVLKYHQKVLASMMHKEEEEEEEEEDQRNGTASSDPMIKKVIEMIEDAGSLRTTSNIWAQEQCKSAMHRNANDLEHFVPERAQEQWERERAQVEKLVAGGRRRRERQSVLKARNRLHGLSQVVSDSKSKSSLFRKIISLGAVDEDKSGVFSSEGESSLFQLDGEYQFRHKNDLIVAQSHTDESVTDDGEMTD